MVIVVLDNSKHMAYFPLSENHGKKNQKVKKGSKTVRKNAIQRNYCYSEFVDSMVTFLTSFWRGTALVINNMVNCYGAVL